MLQLSLNTSARTTALLLLSIVTGCTGSKGPELGWVEGVITINSEPASHVLVEFQPQEPGGSPSYGFADEEGRYKLKFTGTKSGALVGTHTIRVMFDDPSPDAPPPPVQIPPKYNRQSELTAEVLPGTNYHDFDLQVSN